MSKCDKNMNCYYTCGEDRETCDERLEKISKELEEDKLKTLEIISKLTDLSNLKENLKKVVSIECISGEDNTNCKKCLEYYDIDTCPISAVKDEVLEGLNTVNKVIEILNTKGAIKI